MRFMALMGEVAASVAMTVAAAQAGWFDSPVAKAAIITMFGSVLLALLALLRERKSARDAQQMRDDELRRTVEDRTRAAEEGMKVRLADITEDTMKSLRTTIEILAEERNKLAKAASEMQQQMFAATAEVSRLTRENLSLVAQHQTDEQLLASSRHGREALSEELRIVRLALTDAQETIKKGIIAVEREKHDAHS